MFSVILCSRNVEVSDELTQNIEKTAGVEVELVAIDNSEGKDSIFTAYNKGVRQSKGNILCFMHDDVRFRTKDWGGIMQSLFDEDEKLGLIGFAGAHFLPDAPMYWDASPFISEHDLTTRNGQTEECFSLEHFGDKSLAEVVAIDGMCFFIRRSLFDRIAFDEATYKGFHLYDMDISMQVREAGFKVCVCKEVLVEHFYDFNPSKAGFELFDVNLQKFYNKWSSRFPMAVGLEGMTDGMTCQLNNYVMQKMRFEKAYRNITESKAYRLGKTLLNPFKKLKG